MTEYQEALIKLITVIDAGGTTILALVHGTVQQYAYRELGYAIINIFLVIIACLIAHDCGRRAKTAKEIEEAVEGSKKKDKEMNKIGFAIGACVFYTIYVYNVVCCFGHVITASNPLPTMLGL